MRATYIEDREAVRRWLARRHDQQGFNVAKLATALHVSKQAIHRWIHDDVPVPPKYWEALARFFGFGSAVGLMAVVRDRR